MKLLVRNFISCLYRMFRSKLVLLHFLTPLAGIAVFCDYYSVSPWDEPQKVLAYLQIVAMAFPLLSSIAVGMLYETEAKAGAFHAILSVPGQRWTGHIAQLTALLLLAAASLILTVLGFGITFRWMGYAQYGLSLYVQMTGFLFLSNLSLYLLEYLLGFTFGTGAVLSAGILGTLLSPLLYMGLGDPIWQYVPFAYGIRIVTCNFYRLTSEDIFQTVAENYAAGSTTAVIVTLLLLVAFLVFCFRWQGKNISES